MRSASPSCSRVLILAALFAVLAAAAGLAASAPQPPATAAGFLASLSATPAPTVSGAALPSTGALFLSGCVGGCPPGQVCCSLGADPDGGTAFACVVVPRGKCPPVQ